MKTIALYCGSFNPFHIGHLDILQKATDIFGRENVILAQGINPDKPRPETILGDIKALTPYRLTEYSNFTHELMQQIAQENKGYQIVLVRGLRNGHDLAAESDQMQYITDLLKSDFGYPKDVPIVYIPCTKGLEHISSSAIRSLEKFRKGSANKYIVK